MYPPKINEITLTPLILNLIAELDEFKGRWEATAAIAPDRLAALKQIATIESVGSSTRIEGVKLTNSEVEALLRGVKTYSFRSRDDQEVAGYAELMELIFASYQDIPFSENHIKQLHDVLLEHSTKDERHRGEYKKFPNSVEASFHSATPLETPALMKNLIEWTNAEIQKKEMHPLLILGIFVVIFLHIHPFQDGNGRLSRAVTTLLLLKMGYGYVPYSSFERVIEENKDSYYLALRRGQAHPKSGGMTDWLVFFLKSMQKQKVSLEKKIKTELEATKLPQLSLQIIELIKSRGPTSVAEVVAATLANRNTVKLHFKTLVNNGYLLAEGTGRGTRYRIRA